MLRFEAANYPEKGSLHIFTVCQGGEARLFGAMEALHERRESMDKEPLNSANATQVGGQHYAAKPIQPWDFIAANGLGGVGSMQATIEALEAQGI